MTGTDLHIPTIETERLRLRAPAARDFEAFAAFRGSARSAYAGGPFTREEAFNQFCALTGHWAFRGYGRWIAADRQTDAALGLIGLFYPEGWLDPEIAWALLSEDDEGKGLASEGALASRAYAYDVLGWKTVVSLVGPRNSGSAALAARLGATREGVYHHARLGPLDVWRHPGKGAA